jgi:hypothetical protein
VVRELLERRITGRVPYRYFTCPVSAYTRHCTVGNHCISWNNLKSDLTVEVRSTGSIALRCRLLQNPKSLYFKIGLAAYAVSFFLVAIRNDEAGSPLYGFSCAWLAFISLFDHSAVNGGPDTPQMRLAGVCLRITALINPLFLVYIVVPGRTLRLILLAIIPSCWFFFYYEGFVPREGHILWILGMLIVLFSHEPSR